LPVTSPPAQASTGPRALPCRLDSTDRAITGGEA
jgi:hypothetical protein